MVGWTEWIGAIGNLAESDHAVAIRRDRHLISTHRVTWAGIQVDTPGSRPVDEVVGDYLLVEEFRVRDIWPAVRDHVNTAAIGSECKVVSKLTSQWLG